MIDQVHILPQPLQDIRPRAHVRAGLELRLDDSARGRNLADAEERSDCHLLISAVEQPVRAYDWRIENVGAADSHVPARGGAQQGGADEEVVVRGGYIGWSRCVRKGEVLSIGPVRGKGVEKGIGGFAEVSAVLGWEFLECWRWVFGQWEKGEGGDVDMPVASPPPMVERGPD